MYIRGRLFLNAPLEVFELTGKVSGEIAVNARIADERVAVLTNEMWRHRLSLPNATVEQSGPVMCHRRG
jgi:hypothetical protein